MAFVIRLDAYYFMWDPIHGGSVLDYDYVLKFIMIIVRYFIVVVVEKIMTQQSSVLGCF